MKNSIYWNIDSFGTILPENWEDITDKANALITECEEMHGEEAAAEYSTKLWETFCESGEIPTTPETFYQLEIITPSDSYGDLYTTKAEAYEAAEQTWNHLTRSEKAERAFYIHTYGGALKDGETPEDAFLRLIDDNATEDACTETEALYSTEGDLMDDDDSLGWCSAYEIANGEAVFVMNEGKIVSILYQDGTEIVSPSAADIEALARKANPDYEEYDGWKDETILMDAPLDIDLLPCRSCPWFSVCDAMQSTRSPY